MPRLLDDRHENFCRFFVRGPNAGSVCNAYEAAGFKRDTGNASRLYRQPNVRERIEELKAGDAQLERQALRRALEERGLTKAKAIDEISKMAFGEVTGFVDDGGFIDFKRIAQAGAAISHLSIDCVDVDGKPKVTKIRVRMHDKLKALAEFMRQIDLMHEPPTRDYTGMDARSRVDERREMVARMRDMAQDGRDIQSMVDHAMAVAGKPSWDWHIHRQELLDIIAPSIADDEPTGLAGMMVAHPDGPPKAMLRKKRKESAQRKPDDGPGPAAADPAPAAPEAAPQATTAPPAPHVPAEPTIVAELAAVAALLSRHAPQAADSPPSDATPIAQPPVTEAPPQPSPNNSAAADAQASGGAVVVVPQPRDAEGRILALDGLPLSTHGKPGACPVCRSRTCNAGHSYADYVAAGLEPPMAPPEVQAQQAAAARARRLAEQSADSAEPKPIPHPDDRRFSGLNGDWNWS